PQISVLVGPAAGAAAYGPALTDVIIMAPASRVFITGPEVVKAVTGEQIDMEGLGGPEAHSRRSGVAHITADSEADAYLRVRLLVIVDVPGYLPGVGQEWNGVVRRGAKLLHAFADAMVPRVTLVTRKSYGGAYIAMNSRALGATAVFAWPGAEIAVMGPEAAIRILHRRTLADVPPEQLHEVETELAAKHVEEAGGLERAREIGVIDEVIEPSR